PLPPRPTLSFPTRRSSDLELVVQPLDARLGKIQDISAGALMEDGSPVLIVDVEDLIRSVDKLVSGGQLNKVRSEGAAAIEKTQKDRKSTRLNSSHVAISYA